MAPQIYPYALAGSWYESTDREDVCSPYDKRVVGTVCRADAAAVEQAIVAAAAARTVMRQLPTHQRAAILRHVAEQLSNEKEDMARLIALEAAKPIKQARAEVERAIFTFAYAAEETTRIPGELLTMDALPVGEGRHGIVRRVPRGVVAAITPYNFPLNLVAHKVAPAIAAGCPIILKPAPQTPLTALALARMLYNTTIPPQAVSVLPMDTAYATPLVEDDRISVLTFTGSPGVGWHLKQRAGRKHVVLELGGNAGVIIHDDADLSTAVSRIVMGGFSYAGQSCISVQRIIVHNQIYQKFMSLFVPVVQALRLGDPLDETTDLSVVINEHEAQRVAQWLDEARAAGAEVVTGGNVMGGLVAPTILRNVAATLNINCQEVFAPVVTVQAYNTFDEALTLLNASEFGLQAGIFTNDVRRIWHAYDTLDVGGLIVNDVPTWRADHMPYGGVKQSGAGREGVAYAIAEMTEPKLLVLNIQ